MSEKRIQVIKARSLADFFSAKPTKDIIVQYTPRDFTFAPLKPRLIRGEYGTSIQLVQFVNGNWRQISVRLHNIDYLIAAIAALVKMIATAVKMGYLGEEEILETLRAMKGYLQDALSEINNILTERG